MRWEDRGVFIVVGVTGGIAAYKSVHLVRRFVRAGHDVHVIPTDDALRFVGLTTWEAISRNPVTTSVHDDVARVRHVSLGQAADLVVVAPATANMLAKMTAGLADDLLGTTLLATTAPVVVAPAMHTEMWRHAATRANIEILRERGVRFVGPADGELTGGDSGPGRMSEPDEIADAAFAVLAPKDLDGWRVVVSAGGTREPIDPVRYLGNRSSGRQGVDVARAAADRGATVTLVLAHAAADPDAEARRHPGIEVVDVGTAQEMQRAVHAVAATADAIVMAAAVSDYRVAAVSESKMSKEGQAGRTLDLVQNPDILAELAATRTGRQTIVGFAAETEPDRNRLIERGRAKRERKGADLLVVNEVGWSRGFERPDNSVAVIGHEGAVLLEHHGSKREIADALWDAVIATH